MTLIMTTRMVCLNKDCTCCDGNDDKDNVKYGEVALFMHDNDKKG